MLPETTPSCTRCPGKRMTTRMAATANGKKDDCMEENESVSCRWFYILPDVEVAEGIWHVIRDAGG